MAKNKNSKNKCIYYGSSNSDYTNFLIAMYNKTDAAYIQKERDKKINELLNEKT
jgi:hypothetical protein